MGQYTQSGRPISVAVAGLDADALLLEQFKGTEAMSELFRFQLELLAETEVDFNQVLGQKATIRMKLPNGAARVVHGLIAELSQGAHVPSSAGKAAFIRYRAWLVPPLWLLSQRLQSRIFQGMSVPDILHRVLHDDWQLDVAVKLTGGYLPRNYCVQYRETDFAFVSRLMEEEGIAYHFEHSAQACTLVLSDNPVSFAELPELSAVVYSEWEGGKQPAPRIHDWEKRQQLRTYRHASRDYCFQMPDHDLSGHAEIGDGETLKMGKHAHQLAHQRVINGVKMLEAYAYPGDYAWRHDGIGPGGEEQAAELAHLSEEQDRLARVRVQESAARSMLCRGAGDCGHFVPGYCFTLTRHYDCGDTADDAYLLTRVEHQASLKGAYVTSGEEALVYDNRFECLPRALAYRPSRVTPRPRIDGPQTAVVVGHQGEEIFCDKYGRVKVRFRWDRGGAAGAASSCWLRVAQAWAGQSWGALTLPRAGQEVIVGFEEGDPDRPFIQGSLYNAMQMPPYQLPGERRQSGMVSSSGAAADKYHELRFDDTPGSELLHVHSEKDMTVESENDHSTDVGNDQRLKVAKDQSVQVGNDHTLKVAKDQSVTVGNDHSMQVSKDHVVQVGEDHNVQVGKNHNLAVAGTYNIHCGGGGGGSGSGGGIGDLFSGGVADPTGKNVMNTIVDGNATFLFIGGREESRLGLQMNIFVSGAFNVNAGYIMNLGYGWINTVRVGKEVGINAVANLRVEVERVEANVASRVQFLVRSQALIANEVRNRALAQDVTVLRQDYNALGQRVTNVEQTQVNLDQRVTTGAQNHATLGQRVNTIAGLHNEAVAALANHNHITRIEEGALLIP